MRSSDRALTSRTERGAYALAAVCSALAVVPLFWGRYLPFVDLPQHIGAVAILTGGPDAMGFGRHYEPALGGSPYLLPYLVARSLAALVGAVDAVRLMFALALGLVPWAVLACARAFDRDWRILPLSVPLAWGHFVFMGFLNYVLSVPLLLIYVAWWRGQLERPQFRWRQALTGAVLGVVLFYGHVMALALAVGFAGLMAIAGAPTDAAHRPGPTARMVRLFHLLPGLAAFGAWLMWSPVRERGELGRMVGGAMAKESVRWVAPLDALKAWVDHLMSVYHDRTDEYLLLALIAVLIVTTLLRRPAGGRGAPWATIAERLPTVLLAACVVLYFALPGSYRGIYPIGARLVPVAALLVLLVPRGPMMLPRTSIVLGLVLASATTWVHVRHVRAFQAEVGPLQEAIAPIEPGARVVTLVFDRNSRVVRQPAHMHVGQYVVAARGGVTEFSFVNFTKSPVRYVEAEAPPRLPARFEWTPERFDFARDGRWYEYVLVRDGGRSRARTIFKKARSEVDELFRAGPWALYRRKDPGG